MDKFSIKLIDREHGIVDFLRDILEFSDIAYELWAIFYTFKPLRSIEIVEYGNGKFVIELDPFYDKNIKDEEVYSAELLRRLLGSKYFVFVDSKYNKAGTKLRLSDSEFRELIVKQNDDYSDNILDLYDKLLKQSPKYVNAIDWTSVSERLVENCSYIIRYFFLPVNQYLKQYNLDFL